MVHKTQKLYGEGRAVSDPTRISFGTCYPPYVRLSWPELRIVEA